MRERCDSNRAVTDCLFIDLTGQKDDTCAGLAPNPATSTAICMTLTHFATCSSEESTFKKVGFLDCDKL